MAVIGKIQKNSLLLLIVIGLAMLAFIFTDLRGGAAEVEQMDTATLNGEAIDAEEYYEMKDAYIDRSKNEYAYQQKDWTKAAERTAENNAFNEVVRRSILNGEFEKLGIVCTTEELNDMIHGNHIHQWVLQVPIFNGAGGFSKDSVRNFINRIEVEPEGVTDEARQAWLDSRQQWKDFESELKEARKADKYVTMIKKGLFVNKVEAQDQFKSLYTKKEVQYVLQRYADIPAEEFEISDDEIKAYYDKHKNEARYEQEDSRDIQMVYFPIEASAADMENTKDQLIGLKESFGITQNDLGFVYQNSDAKFLSDSTRFSIGPTNELAFSERNGSGSYPSGMDEVIQSAENGDVLGPFMAFNSDQQRREIAIVKVLDTPIQKQAWVRHILISSGATRTEDRAKAIGDSLIRVIKAEDNFAALVPVVSEDPGSIDNGGEYKWFPEGMMVPSFNDAAFNGPIGQLQLVKTTYGYHIVEVLGQAERKTPVLAVVSKVVRPSDETLRDVESIAYDFIYKVSDMKGDSAFNKAAQDSGMVVQPTRLFLSNEYVIGMQNPERMMGFAFNSNTTDGTISDPILDEDKYIVAIVDNVIDEGVPDFEDVKEVMRKPALKEKQGEAYVAKMSGKGNLEDVAAGLTNGFVRSVEVTFDSKAVLTGGQPDPLVVGKLFTNIPVGQITKPIIGEEGVYVFVIDSETPAPEALDLSVVRDPMRIKRLSTSDNRVIEALREKANLVDNRRKIEYN